MRISTGRDPHKVFRWVYLLPLLAAFIMVCVSPGMVRAAVELLYFRAIPGAGWVDLEWATATELNTLGFFIQRSSQRESGYTRINSQIIIATGGELTGGEYEYRDSGLANGTYWYILEEIDTSQNSSTTTPISAVVGPAATPTPTVTLTATSITGGTATQTTQPVGTARISTTQPAPTSRPVDSQQTALPTFADPNQLELTAYPPLQQPAAPAAPVIVGADAGSQGPTATLLPFPTVTILFPKETGAPPPDFSKIPGYGEGFDWQEIVHLWPLGLILLAWIVLGAWFFISHRQA
jgi:hypothetical protein